MNEFMDEHDLWRKDGRDEGWSHVAAFQVQLVQRNPEGKKRKPTAVK